MTRLRSGIRLAGIAAVFALGACDSSPRPIVYDRDACDYCRMTISDRRFGGQVVSAKRRVRTFDSIECLATFVVSQDGIDVPRQILVTDYDHPGVLVPAPGARFLRVSGPSSSPMAGGLVAFSPDADTAALQRRSGGELLTWNDVITSARDAARPVVVRSAVPVSVP
jgi:copper chaperone NosL